MEAAVTFRASLPAVAHRELTVRPYRIAGTWAHDGAWGPMLARGDALSAARAIAHRLNWPAAVADALT